MTQPTEPTPDPTCGCEPEPVDETRRPHQLVQVAVGALLVAAGYMLALATTPDADTCVQAITAADSVFQADIDLMRANQNQEDTVPQLMAALSDRTNTYTDIRSDCLRGN